MAVTKLLDKLPDWPSFEIERVLRAVATDPIVVAVNDIVSRVMGDVLDWLRTTPNAVVPAT